MVDIDYVIQVESCFSLSSTIFDSFCQISRFVRNIGLSLYRLQNLNSLFFNSIIRHMRLHLSPVNSCLHVTFVSLS